MVKEQLIQSLSLDPKIVYILENISDPEVPVLSVLDLGIIKEVRIEDKTVFLRITPTYTGCPAMDMISVNLKAGFQEAGYDTVHVDLVLSPVWTTDFMSEEGKQKLKAYGIAPPQTQPSLSLFDEERSIVCPQCESTDTEMVSRFGSTACKALYKCHSCNEPFDYFKCH